MSEITSKFTESNSGKKQTNEGSSLQLAVMDTQDKKIESTRTEIVTAALENLSETPDDVLIAKTISRIEAEQAKINADFDKQKEWVRENPTQVKLGKVQELTSGSGLSEEKATDLNNSFSKQIMDAKAANKIVVKTPTNKGRMH